jgi:argininosuccinate synthase
MSRFITSFEALTARLPNHLVLLYSGGVDGTYLLQRLCAERLRVIALNVRIGTEPASPTVAAQAARFGADFREVDATGDFYAEFVPPAIHADAYYQGQYPVGSTLTRPLMARVAVEVARELGADAVGHTATYTQNSSVRLTRSIVALEPELDVVAPFLGTAVTREEKVASLARSGITFATGLLSIDENPWARVIESGSLENPEWPLDESVFAITRDPETSPAGGLELDLEFDAGLPVALDGVRRDLAELVPLLNAVAGRHGIGRFSGLEDTPFGVKSHEVRESPGAAVITTAHRTLANAVYGTQEHLLRAHLGAQWTNAAVHGAWFSHVSRCLADCLARLDEPVTGSVRLRLHRGTLTVLRVEAARGIYFARLGHEYHEWMREYAYAPWLHLATLADRLAVPARTPGDPVTATGKASG